jgi:hypothetical protein
MAQFLGRFPIWKKGESNPQEEFARPKCSGIVHANWELACPGSACASWLARNQSLYFWATAVVTMVRELMPLNFSNGQLKHG